MKKIISIISIIIIGALMVYRLQSNKEKNQKEVEIVAQNQGAVAVRVGLVTYEKVENKFDANGVFIAGQDLNVSAELPGQVVKILVKEGDFVKQGQALAQIKSDKINVALTQATSVLNNASQELKRFESAYKTGGVTAQQLEKIQLQYQNAQANYQTAKLNASDIWVRSKISGIVSAKTIEEGTFVGVGTVLFNVVNITDLKIKVSVDENQVTNLKVGQQVKIKPSVGDSFLGKISFVSPKSNGALKFLVEISVENPNQRLKAGMYANVEFSSETNQQILIVPREAFVGSISQNKIFKIVDSKAVWTTVKSGRSFGDKVEIISGLSVDDQVVISGQINLDNGTLVKIVK